MLVAAHQAEVQATIRTNLRAIFSRRNCAVRFGLSLAFAGRGEDAKATEVPTPAKILRDLKGIGAEFAIVRWSEELFRHFDNRRQVATYAGLAPTPWQSGTVDREHVLANPELRSCGQPCCNSRGCGCDASRTPRSVAGSMRASLAMAVGPQDDDNRTRPKASRRTLEIRHPECGHRRSNNKGSLNDRDQLCSAIYRDLISLGRSRRVTGQSHFKTRPSSGQGIVRPKRPA